MVPTWPSSLARARTTADSRCSSLRIRSTRRSLCCTLASAGASLAAFASMALALSKKPSLV